MIMDIKSLCLFLKPVFKEKIWGGKRLRTDFGYDIPSDKTGECWAISAHPEGECLVCGGDYDGMKLSELWNTHREVFGNAEGDRFPLLTKILDAESDLSIQVHPDDAYAMVHENGSLGKNECWYVIHAEPGTKIIIGHKAKTREELKEMMDQGRWDDLIRQVPIKAGDFFQIVPGTVHAIKGGTMVLETQQSSDVTYRMYDYDRLENGHPRQLHKKQCLDVINVPFKEEGIQVQYEDVNDKPFKLVECRFYKIYKLNLMSHVTLQRGSHPYVIASCIEGSAELSIGDESLDLKKGSHFIITSLVDEFRLKASSADTQFIFSVQY
ncbi:MAG: mannose-6-phosphate isomerase, class I [Lachnospiraceae bacterium]|nr:mannose-6-phosphate isomerase, class I [Lachnospiraceae bacterium]MEE3461338.1 mannose-6-phosphate isomerase, class I [Lachnospiraceae bacterium]